MIKRKKKSAKKPTQKRTREYNKPYHIDMPFEKALEKLCKVNGAKS